MTQRTFYVPRVVGPLQVELPEFKTKGRKGALHIRPSSTLFLSDDEVKFLGESHAVLFSTLRETTPKEKEGTKSLATGLGDYAKANFGSSAGSGSDEKAPSYGQKKKGKGDKSPKDNSPE